MGNTTHCANARRTSSSIALQELVIQTCFFASSSVRNQKSTQALIYATDKTVPARHEQKPTEKMTQLKQPKKVGLFHAKKQTTLAAPESEVGRIIAGMQRNA